MGGWMDGWVDVKAGLRIAYSNQKYHILSLGLILDLILNTLLKLGLYETVAEIS